MPNIMITYRCNLRCPYCFANEYVNRENTDITIQNFEKVIEFITKEQSSYLGLIGGEPTIHKDFKKILRSIINNQNIIECTVYTNGIELDKYINELSSPKFRLLVNCNSPKTIGDDLYDRIIKNLDILFNERYMENRIDLGFNFYDDDIDCSFIIEMLKRYSLHRVRLSLTVPNMESCKQISAIDYFKQRKEGLLALLKKFRENQIVPYYDCNKIPYCLWSEDEKKWLHNYVDEYNVKESDLIGNRSICYPVIDILPTLEVVRCFGMSSFEKVKITDFEGITDIASYFLNTIDCEAYRIAGDEKCSDCYYRKTRHCTAGCLCFKSDKINMMNNLAKKL